MFTGIIEEIGEVVRVDSSTKSSILCITAMKIIEDMNVGDSICVNGVCLTVTRFVANMFWADVMSETLLRSNLGILKKGSLVNLERAVKINGRFGGHIVSGHIDGTGVINSIEKDDNAVWYSINADKELMKYVIGKGSIAIDGISLTVAKCNKSSFDVSIIPHTICETILSEKKVGDTVNLENDMVGKYVEKLINFREDKSRITVDFLAEHGFC